MFLLPLISLCFSHTVTSMTNKQRRLTTQKKYVSVHNLSVAIYLKNNINGFKLSLQNSQEFRVEGLYLEHGFISCNVHDSCIYLNIIFGKKVHLTSFQLNMQLFPICHKKSKRELYFTCIFLHLLK